MTDAPAKPAGRSSLYALVAANLLPLAGAAFLGWKAGDVIFLYWMENLVIGAYNILRIVAAIPDPAKIPPAAPTPTASQLFWGKMGLAAFFAVHYGGFCYGHGMFLTFMFAIDTGGRVEPDLFALVAELLREPGLAYAFIAIIASHGYSFARNYILGGEYRKVELDKLMFQPYKRIFVTHIFIILGGFLLIALKSPLPAMVLFVGLKIAIDAYLHRREHAAAAQNAG